MKKHNHFIIHLKSTLPERNINGTKVCLSRELKNDINPKKPMRQIIGTGEIVISNGKLSIKITETNTPNFIHQMTDNDINIITENTNVRFTSEKITTRSNSTNAETNLFVKQLK